MKIASQVRRLSDEIREMALVSDRWCMLLDVALWHKLDESECASLLMSEARR